MDVKQSRPAEVLVLTCRADPCWRSEDCIEILHAVFNWTSSTSGLIVPRTTCNGVIKIFRASASNSSVGNTCLVLMDTRCACECRCRYLAQDNYWNLLISMFIVIEPHSLSAVCRRKARVLPLTKITINIVTYGSCCRI